MFTPPINNPTFNIPPGIISPALELILRNVYSNVQWPASLGEVRTQFTVPRPGFLLGTSTAEIGGKERSSPSCPVASINQTNPTPACYSTGLPYSPRPSTIRLHFYPASTGRLQGWRDLLGVQREVYQTHSIAPWV